MGLYIIVGEGRLIYHEQKVVFLIHVYRSKNAFLVNVILITFENLICCIPLVVLKAAIYKVTNNRMTIYYQSCNSAVFQRNMMLQDIFPPTDEEIKSENRYEDLRTI